MRVHCLYSAYLQSMEETMANRIIAKIVAVAIHSLCTRLASGFCAVAGEWINSTIGESSRKGIPKWINCSPAMNSHSRASWLPNGM